jgi:transglutaminase-like putative cysteine protease
MSDVAVERLVKTLTERPANDQQSPSGRPRRPVIELHFSMDEGWFSLFLLATVVYSTTWCIQAVGWVDHLDILTLTTAIGLIIGVLAAKQRRFPRLPVHSAVLVFAILLAFWQTAGAFYQGNAQAFLLGIHHWITTVLSGGSGDDDSIFLFFITALSFLLAYTSVWLVYRTRSPWLMIVANAVVLLINLSNVDSSYMIFLAVFLIASLLLLLRFNLYESLRRWRKHGLRYADDIGWDVMQAGTLLSIGILIFSWLLPWGYTNPLAAQIWTANTNPWVQLQNTWNRVISVEGGSNPSNHGNFRDTLVLGGNPNLNHDVVMTVQTDDDGSQYLESLSYDTYLGRGGWTDEAVDNTALPANQSLSYGPALSHPVKQQIKLVNPPGEQKAYLLGASQIIQVSVPANVQSGANSGDIVAWVSRNGSLTAGMQYTVTSLVSSADVQTLRSVPMPTDAPQYPPDYPGSIPPTVYDPNIVKANLQLPPNLDPSIAALARQITLNAPTMYDKVAALEEYLRTNYTYSVQIQPPPGEEPVSWFLFRSGRKGFCNYFASAMAIMARTLGIPARVAVGYTNGTYDATHHDHVIRGTDAHAWTQVYFAGYGWINFEPSASFATLSRPLPNEFVSITGNTEVGGLGPSALPGIDRRLQVGPDASNGATGTTSATVTQTDMLRQDVGMTLGGLVLLLLFCCILFGIWWTRLFRRYGLAAHFYGRICLLANWAGIELRLSQTPYEYMQELAAAAPEYAATLERVGEIYVRDRWADPQSSEHPQRTGEVHELRNLWKYLQPRLFFYVLRHPHFLRWLPAQVGRLLTTLRRRRQKRKIVEEEDDF